MPTISMFRGIKVYINWREHRPPRRYILSQNGLADNLKTSSFESEIVKILVEKKFRRNRTGCIEGFGTVIYPR